MIVFAPTLRASRPQTSRLDQVDERIATRTLMNHPLRIMIALFLIGAFGGIAIWRIVGVLQSRGLTKTMRLFDISVIVLFMALLIALVIFYWPADQE